MQTSFSGNWQRGMRLVLVFASLWLLEACGGSVPWRVVRASGPPSALRGASKVALQFDYSSVVVEGMSEADWIQSKKAEKDDYEQTWANLKNAFETAFVDKFSAKWGAAIPLAAGSQPPPNATVAKIVVNSIDIGHYIPFASSNTVVNTSMIWSVKGAETDEIIIDGRFSPNMVENSVFQHMKHIGDYLGGIAAWFLETKQED